jgi:hypothetical protein
MRRHGAQFTDEPQLIDDTTFQAKLKTDRLLSVPGSTDTFKGN